VIAAAIMNACKVTNRELGELRVVINGAGAAGTATFDLLSGMGVGDIIVNDLAGILCAGQVQSPAHHVSIAAHSNRDRRQGGLAEAVRGADVFIGVSVARQPSPDMIRAMQWRRKRSGPHRRRLVKVRMHLLTGIPARAHREFHASTKLG
jgi:malate dehydrogenase (oxaloacetate-decarboxylating)